MPLVLLNNIEEAPSLPIYQQTTCLHSADLDLLRPFTIACTKQPYEEVFAVGAPAQEIYIVLSGSVLTYTRQSDGKLRALDRIGPGSFFGEVAALFDGFRSANAVALETTELLLLDSAHLTSLMQQRPQIAQLFMRGMAERLRRGGRDIGNAALREPKTRKALNVRDRMILGAARFLGGGGFLLLFFASLCVWSAFHEVQRLDPNATWIALALTVLQIVISNLVLNSQMRADALEAEVESEVQQASLKAEAGINTVRSEQQQMQVEILRRLDELQKSLEAGPSRLKKTNKSEAA
jgi:uncharacterized membrane protein